MPRIEIEDLPVSVDLSAEEAQAVQGGSLNFSTQQSGLFSQSLTVDSGGSESVLIGLLLPAVQKVR